MSTIYNGVGWKQTATPARPRVSVFNRCRAVFREWREREQLRARLGDLSDRELHDIGIGRGEVDYVASNRSIDPRGAACLP